ncbi:MAG: hypothetical protein ACREQI_00500 [Candidatus Binataceae bacterium]
MQKRIVIRGSAATPEDVADLFRIPKRRVKELQKMVDEILAGHQRSRKFASIARWQGAAKPRKKRKTSARRAA